MFRRYAFAWCYLGVYVVAEVIYAALSPAARAALDNWATTSVANLEHEPVGPLLASAFIGPGNYFVLPLLIALALFGANRALGNLKTAAVCTTGHVIGTLVSEGIAAYRVDHGLLPVADRYLTDLGPSYVVMSAIVIALICGTRAARIAAALDLAILVFFGDIFGGLSRLAVPAVGHLTATITAAAFVLLVVVRRRRYATWPTAMPIR